MHAYFALGAPEVRFVTRGDARALHGLLVLIVFLTHFEAINASGQTGLRDASLSLLAKCHRSRALGFSSLTAARFAPTLVDSPGRALS